MTDCNKSVCIAFRKVYGILMVQLSITVGFIAWFTYHEGTKQYVQRHIELLYISLVVMIVGVIIMSCCGNVRRKTPMNYIFLFIFTLAVSFMLGVVSSTLDAETVSIIPHDLLTRHMLLPHTLCSSPPSLMLFFPYNWLNYIFRKETSMILLMFN